jgi:hypothetical protein
MPQTPPIARQGSDAYGFDDDEVADVEQKQTNETSNPTDELEVKDENNRVARSKGCVYFVVALAALAVGLSTYFLMQQDEVTWYQDEVSKQEGLVHLCSIFLTATRMRCFPVSRTAFHAQSLRNSLER